MTCYIGNIAILETIKQFLCHICHRENKEDYG